MKAQSDSECQRHLRAFWVAMEGCCKNLLSVCTVIPHKKRERKSLRYQQLSRLQSEAKNNDSYRMDYEETNPTWTRLEEIPHEDGWSDHKTDMSI